MKKIIITLAFVALSSVSAKAIGLPNFEVFEVTAGLATNSGVFGASAKETGQDGAGVDRRVKKESGVFTDSYTSQFIELGIGQWITVGYEHTPDSLSTPTQTSGESTGTETNVSVDFNDLNTTYLKLELPFLPNFYVKTGTVETDLDIKEVMGSGSTYKNVSTSGTMMGAGYSRYIKDTGFGIRAEAAYMELDPVSTDNGVAKGTVNNAAGGGVNNNRIDASNLEGLSAKVAITYTFGKN
tara:strand:+ start:606 stop:1325 length:720 start_codon:yes stop_codon:yes gene_type:complete